MVRAHPDIPGLVDWQPLARGGFSTVWQARQEHLDRLVAVKVDHRTLTEDKERRRFLREAGAAGRLSGHPGIVTVYDAGILPDARPYLVMDLCPGGSLTRWLKPEGRHTQQQIRDVGVRIAGALAAAHAQQVLHRDVKPANILIDKYGLAGLADFGLAAMPEPGVELSVTLEGMTPAYAPKEVFYRRPPSEYGDVYSLAATLYALLDGKPPRWPDTGTPSLPELLDLQRTPIERLPGVDAGFMDLLLQALADDPEQRLSAADFRDRLAALSLAGDAPTREPQERPPAGQDTQEPAHAAPVATGGVAARRAVTTGRRSSRRGLAAVLAVAGLVLAVFLVNIFGNTTGARSGAAPLGAATGTPAAPSDGDPAGSTAASPTPSAASPTPSAASPTASQPPEGFVDCTQRLGGSSYCVTTPECWTDLYGYANLTLVGTIQDCDKPHLYQTYAAGELKKPAQRESDFEARAEVQALCTPEHLDQALKGRKRLADWQIVALPPQTNLRDNLFRCLFSTGGTRTGAVKLKILR